MNKEQISQRKPRSNVMKKKIQNLEYSRNKKLGKIMKEKEPNLMGASKLAYQLPSGLGSISIFPPVFSTPLTMASVFLSPKVLCSLADFLSYPALRIISKPSAELLRNESIRRLYS